MPPLGEGAPGFKLKGLGSCLGDEEVESSLEAVEKELRVCGRQREWKHESTGQGVTRLRAPNCPYPLPLPHHQLRTFVQNENSLPFSAAS